MTIALIMIVAIRLAWAGSWLPVFSAVVLVVALAMSAAGYVPYVLEGFVLAGRAIVFGAKRLTAYRWPGRLAAAQRRCGGTFASLRRVQKHAADADRSVRCLFDV
jgi:hypothetical protein